MFSQAEETLLHFELKFELSLVWLTTSFYILSRGKWAEKTFNQIYWLTVWLTTTEFALYIILT